MVSVETHLRFILLSFSSFSCCNTSFLVISSCASFSFISSHSLSSSSCLLACQLLSSSSVFCLSTWRWWSGGGWHLPPVPGHRLVGHLAQGVGGGARPTGHRNGMKNKSLSGYQGTESR